MKTWMPVGSAVALVAVMVLTGACTVPEPPAPTSPQLGSPQPGSPQPGSSQPGSPAAPAASGAALVGRIDAFLGASRWGRYDGVSDVLVVVDGQPVVERHRLASPDRRREIGGVTAAVLVALVGIVRADGGLGDVQQPLVELLPEVPPELAGATLHQLLVGTSADHLDVLAAVLTRAAGRPVPDLAQERLFAPLGIAPSWPGDAAGPAVTAREMAVLGALWLDDGLVDGRQVVPAEWIEATIRPYRPTGRPRLPYAGYRQWVGRVGGHAATALTGEGGQLVEMVPSMGLVVVVTCDEDPTPLAAPPAGSEAFVEMVSSIVVPALD